MSNSTQTSETSVKTNWFKKKLNAIQLKLDLKSPLMADIIQQPASYAVLAYPACELHEKRIQAMADHWIIDLALFCSEFVCENEDINIYDNMSELMCRMCNRITTSIKYFKDKELRLKEAVGQKSS